MDSTSNHRRGQESDDRREKVTESNGGGKFSELFEVITKYSQGDYDHQEQALRVIAGVYDVPFEAEAMPDAS